VFERRLVKPDEIVSNVGKLLQRLIGEDIHVITDLQADLVWVKADPTQLDQVLMNLAVNARDAMPEGGTLTIKTAAVELDEIFVRSHSEVLPGKYLSLSVTDTGCGMDGETRSRLFEPFFTTKEPGKGTGLGLSIVHGIVQQSGGHILVSSEPGLGTTFTIFLPSAEPPVEKPLSLDAVEATRRGSETVLLVEDEGQVRTLERDILKARGYHVLTAGHGKDALRICQEYPEPIHLLVTDLILPHMNGRELARRVLPMRASMKVLFVSGYPDETLLSAGVARNTVPFLQKPFASEMFLRTVRNVLDKQSEDTVRERSP
jgi:CheY-like chemotaxis protein